MEITDTAQDEKIAQFLVDAAVWAPSVHDTQPWWFGTRGSTVTMHADRGRRLDTADPEGREMLISCGAALYTLRLAVRHLGRVPEVQTLPDPGRPGVIADVGIGKARPATAEEGQMYPQIRRRHTHRGGFRPGCLPTGLLQALRTQAYGEGVSLRIMADPRARVALAALTEAAEQVQRQNPAYAAEVARWAPAPAPGDDRAENAGEGASDPAADFAHGHGSGEER